MILSDELNDDPDFQNLEEYESKRDERLNDPDKESDGFPDQRQERSTPDEVFDKMKQLKIDLETEIFGVDRHGIKMGGKPSLNRKAFAKFEFGRNLGLDLRPDYDFIDDDLLTNASLYAYYDAQLNLAKRMLKRAEHELKILKANLRIHIRENWNNANVPADALTKDFLESYVDRDLKVILLQEILDEMEYCVNQMGTAVKSMRMKHDSCRTIATNRQGESYLIGSSRVRNKEEKRQYKDYVKKVTLDDIEARKGKSE